MAFKQLITPNLDDNKKKPLYVYQNGKILTNWVGWCLAVVKAAYGATKSMGTALKAWNADQTKHSGSYDLPEGLYVPIYWKGDKQNYGHVAIARRTGNQVKIWSSPYKKSATFTIFSGEIKSTISKVCSTYGCNTYLGWTERVCEKTVIQAVNLKSNEEICAEVWAGKWGTGTDRKNRLAAAGYDYATIQKMVDAGVGKPATQKPAETAKPSEPKNEPTTAPEPTQKGSSEATEPIEDASSEPNYPDTDKLSDNSSSDSETNSDETTDTKDEVVPVPSADTKLIGDIIGEASSAFNPSEKVKLIAYLVGDALLLGAVLVPDVINTIQAPTMSIMGEYLSRTLMEAGVFILLVFKLIKRGK